MAPGSVPDWEPLLEGSVPPEPMELFHLWYQDVLAADVAEPTAMVLVTTSAAPASMPRGRHVLLKSADAHGFAWVSNQRSIKGQHLQENPQGSLLFPWFPRHRQVLVAGQVALASDAESDAYFKTRSRGSQLAAWASHYQSEPIADRAELEQRWASAAERFDGEDVERPPYWGMYRLVPTTIEFWQQQPFRMHDRLVYQRMATGDQWTLSRLLP